MGIFDMFAGKDKKIIKTKKAPNPQVDPYSESGGVTQMPQLSRYPLPPRYLKWLAFNIDILRTTIQHLKNEIFINGIDIEASYESKCLNPECEKTFEYITEQCDECKQITGTPDWLERKTLEKILHKANDLGQPLIDVFREIEEDLEIYDNGMMLTQFEYMIDNRTGEILGAVPKEHKSLSPVYMIKKISEWGEIGAEPDGTPARICLGHRDKLTSEMKCPLCGWVTHPVEFAEYYGKKMNYYIVGEIMHRTKYTATKKMGYSNIYAVWMKLYALYYLDEQQMKQFQEGRPPKGFMVMNMAQSMLDSLVTKVRDMIRSNPNTIPFLAVETQARKMAEFINVSGTSSDQQLIEHRDAIRRMIASLYGVTPLFTGDIQTSGGMNSEGQQMIVTNKSVKRGQDKINEFGEEVARLHNVKAWTIMLPPAEEKDDLREEQLEQMKVQTASMMVQMGFEVERNDAGDFEFSDTPENPTQQASNSPSWGSQSPSGPPSGGFGGSSPSSNLFSESQPFEKADKMIEEEDKTLDAIYKELKGILKVKKKKLTQADLKKMRELLLTHFQDISWAKLEKFIHKQYMNEIDKLEIDFGRNVTQAATLGIITGLLTSEENKEAMEKLWIDQNLKFDEIVQEASKDGAFDPLVFKKQLKELTNFSESRINNIVRTTSNKISNSARMRVYAEFDDEKARYKLITVHDKRRCSYCENVEKRVKKEGKGKGLPLNTLLNIMEEESNAGYAPDWKFSRELPSMHWQTRSVIQRM